MRAETELFLEQGTIVISKNSAHLIAHGRYILSLLSFLKKYYFFYLAVPGLSMWDLVP